MESKPTDQMSEEELERYLAWRERYSKQNRKDKRNWVIRIVASTLLLITVYFTWKLYMEDELQFIGRETTIISGEVTRTSWKSFSRNSVLQRVYFKFEFRNQAYEGIFINSGDLGKFQEGECVVIKIAVNDPEKNTIKGGCY